MYPLLWLATITTLLNWLHLWGLLSPEVPLSFPHMHATSHLLTGAHTCKWQSVAGIIKVEVPWKRTAGLLELQEAFLWSNHTVSSLLKKVRTLMLWKACRKSSLKEHFRSLQIKKKIQKKKRHDVFSPAHTMPTGVFSLAYHQNLSGKYDSVLYSSHQYHDVTVTAGGKPILIIHQGNNHHTCSNIILMQMFPKSTVYRMTIAKWL